MRNFKRSGNSQEAGKKRNLIGQFGKRGNFYDRNFQFGSGCCNQIFPTVQMIDHNHSNPNRTITEEAVHSVMTFLFNSTMSCVWSVKAKKGKIVTDREYPLHINSQMYFLNMYPPPSQYSSKVRSFSSNRDEDEFEENGSNEVNFMIRQEHLIDGIKQAKKEFPSIAKVFHSFISTSFLFLV